MTAHGLDRKARDLAALLAEDRLRRRVDALAAEEERRRGDARAAGPEALRAFQARERQKRASVAALLKASSSPVTEAAAWGWLVEREAAEILAGALHGEAEP